MNIPDGDIRDWRDNLKKGIVKMTTPESIAMLNEVLKLRQTVRRMENKVLKATQTTLLKDG